MNDLAKYPEVFPVTQFSTLSMENDYRTEEHMMSTDLGTKYLPSWSMLWVTSLPPGPSLTQPRLSTSQVLRPLRLTPVIRVWLLVAAS